MVNYFIKNEHKEQGPFTLVQLMERAIKKDTLVWYAGLAEWCAAEDIFELQELFIEKSSRPGFSIPKFIKVRKKH